MKISRGEQRTISKKKNDALARDARVTSNLSI